MPNNDFFSGEGFDQGPVKNGPAPGNADDGSLDDAFAGMQKLDLFDEEPSAPETGAPGVTQLFEPVGGQPAAPQKNIGEMVFGDVFGPQADGAAQPAGPDAASAPVEIPLETVGVPGAPEPLVQEITFDDEPAPQPEARPAAPQQAAAPQQPAAAAPAGEAHRFPEDPMPKRSPAKPIDWNADLLSRKRPAAAPVPVQAAPAQAAAPTGDPAWKQLLDNAVKDTPADTEATKVFDPAPEARPAVPQQPAAPAAAGDVSSLAAPQPRQGTNAVELTGPVLFDFDQPDPRFDPPAQPAPAAQPAAQPAAPAQPLSEEGFAPLDEEGFAPLDG